MADAPFGAWHKMLLLLVQEPFGSGWSFHREAVTRCSRNVRIVSRARGKPCRPSLFPFRQFLVLQCWAGIRHEVEVYPARGEESRNGASKVRWNLITSHEPFHAVVAVRETVLGAEVGRDHRAILALPGPAARWRANCARGPGGQNGCI